MKFLTETQKQWIVRKKIKVGSFYTFPSMGFYVYSEPDFDSGEYLDTNPLTKSLTGQFFVVKEKVNGFCRGNFHDRPVGSDMYITEDELSRRSILEILGLTIISFLPMVIYNIFKKHNDGTIETKNEADKI